MYYGSGSGSRFYQGNPANGKIISWLLEKTTDSVGNEIYYDWFLPTAANQFAGGYYPSTIRYGGNVNAGTPNDLKVVFNYLPNTAAPYPSGALYGHKLVWSNLLSSIHTELDGSILRTWTLSYGTPTAYPFGNGNPVSRKGVAGIQECAGAACLPPTTFDRPSQTGYLMTNGGTMAGHDTNFGTNVPIMFDNDAKSDIGNGRLTVAPFTTDYSIVGFIWRAAFPTAAPLAFGAPVPRGGGQVVWADLNADGLTDISYVSCKPITTTECAVELQSWVSNGTAFVQYRNLVIQTATLPTNAIHTVIAGDFKGNGRNGILVATNTGKIGTSAATQIVGRIIYPTADSGDAPAVGALQYFGTMDSGNVLDTWQIADLNGDAVDDVVRTDNLSGQGLPVTTAFLSGQGAAIVNNAVPATTGWGSLSDPNRPAVNSVYLQPKRILFTDFNNDNLADVLYYYQSGNTFWLRYAFNDGENSSPSELSQTVVVLPKTLPTSDAYNPVTLDLDGDGYNDILLAEDSDEQNHRFVPIFSTASNLAPGLANFVVGIGTNTVLSKSHGRAVTGDIDGDARGDFLFVTGDSNSKITRISYPAYANARVNRITNGLGYQVNVTYKPISDATVYSDDGLLNTGITNGPMSYPHRQLNAPVHVVSGTKATNPSQADYAVDYTYKNARLSVSGRGFVGFGGMTATDQAAGIVEETSYIQTFPFYGMISYRLTRTSAGAKIREWSGTPVAANTVHGAWFPYYQSSSDMRHEVTPGYQGPVTHLASTYAFDTHGNRTRLDEVTYDAVGNWHWTATVDAFGEDDESQWCLGRLTNRKVSRLNSAGSPLTLREHSYTYDSGSCLLESESDEPSGASVAALVKTFERDVFGNIISTTVSGSDITTRVSTAEFENLPGLHGRAMTRSCNALGQCSLFTVDAGTGAVTSGIDPNGLVTRFSFDPFGRAAGYSVDHSLLNKSSNTSIVSCSTQPQHCSGASTAVIAQVTVNSDGSASSAATDLVGRNVRSAFKGADGDWRESFTRYDVAGRKAAVSSPRRVGSTALYETKYFYDSTGRVSSVLAPHNENLPAARSESTSFRGLTTVWTDSNGRTKTTVSNAIGNLVGVTDQKNFVVNYEYDTSGRLRYTRRVHPSTGATIVSESRYDVRGNRTVWIEPDRGTWVYMYNALGEPLTQQDAAGQLTSYFADALGRPTEIADPETIKTFVWDEGWIGEPSSTRRLSVTTGSVQSDERFEYSDVGALKSRWEVVDGVSFNTSYAHDDHARVVQERFPSGLTVVRTYNANGALVAAGKLSGQTYWQADTWGDDGSLETVSLGGNAVVMGTYRDAAVGSVKSILAGPGGSNSVADLEYQWKNDGTTERRLDHGSGQTEVFAYDELNRLQTNTVTNPSPPKANESFTQNAIGNITSKGGIGYSYDASRVHAVKGVGSATFDYGASGDQTAVRAAGSIARTYSWSAQHELLAVDDLVGPDLEFSYASDGRLVKLVRVQSGQSTTSRYASDELAEFVGTGASSYWRISIDSPLGPVALITQRSGAPDVVQYLQKDAQGSTIAITNESGTVIQRYAYDSFGTRSVTFTGAGYAGVLYDRGYTGHLQLDGLGLIHMRARVLDSIRGRFLSPDDRVGQLDDPQGLNLYSYVLNNPHSLTDPTGHEPLSFNVVLPMPRSPTVSGLTSNGFRSATFASFNAGQIRAPGNLAGGLVEGYSSKYVVSPGAESGCPGEGCGASHANSANAITGVPSNQSLSQWGKFANGAIAAVVPGAYYMQSAQAYWATGQYGWAVASTTGAFVDAGIWIISLGQSSALSGSLRGISTAVTSQAGSIRGVNALGGRLNCVNCVVATDATLAGRPASALSEGPFRIDVLERHYGARFGASTSIADIARSVSAAGPGARGIVFGSRVGDVGHVFNVANQNGVVRFLDGQSGGAASVSGYNGFRLLRTN